MPPWQKFFILRRKNIGKLGLPLLCASTSAQQKYAPLFEILNTPLHGALPQTTLGSVLIVLPRFRSSYLGFEFGKRKRDDRGTGTVVLSARQNIVRPPLY